MHSTKVVYSRLPETGRNIGGAKRVRIHIKNLRVRTIIGVNDWERNTPQDVLVNVEFEFDAAAAAESDDLRHAVDYAALSERITALVKDSRFFLLEKLASEILKLVVADDRVQSASVMVEKPAAIPAAESVSVTASGSRR